LNRIFGTSTVHLTLKKEDTKKFQTKTGFSPKQLALGQFVKQGLIIIVI
jgi:hypothetical protein